MARPRRTAACAAAAAAALLGVARGQAWPTLAVRQALQLAEEPAHENLATNNQALGVWRDGAPSAGRELVVALTHQFNDLDRRADDREYVVAWESDGSSLTEVERILVSCPNLEVTVPTRGPYVYEARVDFSPGSLHPECSCVPNSGTACPLGMRAMAADRDSWNATSVVDSHFVLLENEWEELIRDPASLYQLRSDLEAPVAVVNVSLLNSTATAPDIVELACPGSHDDLIGGPDVTEGQLRDLNMRLPDGLVEGKWCLVSRGGCSETAKVKVCAISGAVGTIIVDHANFPGDQEIRVRYRRGANEVATRPVLFVSLEDGAALAAAAAAGGVRVAVGPSIAGPPPPGYAPGSGITVHAIGAAAPATGPRSRSFPELFGTVGWIEVSDVRDLLFVCLATLGEVRLYNISAPMEQISLLGRIQTPCSRYGLHDYRVLDYLGRDGRFRTALVDPFDFGNRLYYYDTHNPAAPVLELELQLAMEADNDGLGQVRAGGPDGRFHIVTWHCSDIFCGKSHGDSLHVLDSWNFTQAIEVPLPMLTQGAMARDIACGADGLCLVSLTWSGIAALDTGVEGTRNAFGIVASHVGGAPFSTAEIPEHQSYLRLYSGAQKVYASKLFPRHFYIEHADLSIRHFRLDDGIRALQLKKVYIAEVMDYNCSVDLGVSPLAAVRPLQEAPGEEPAGFRVTRNVHMGNGNDTTVGMWFFFDLAAFPSFVVPGLGRGGQIGVQQFRGSSLVWSGRVDLYRSGPVGFGRREAEASAGQWQIGDIIHIPAFHQAWTYQGDGGHTLEGRRGTSYSTLVVVVMVLLTLLLVALLFSGLFYGLYVKEQHANRVQTLQLDHHARAAAGADAAVNNNVVMGKPIGSDTAVSSDLAAGTTLGPGPATCKAPTKSGTKSVEP